MKRPTAGTWSFDLITAQGNLRYITFSSPAILYSASMRVYHSNMAGVGRLRDIDNERIREDPAFGVRSAQLDFDFDIHSFVVPGASWHR